MFCLVIIIVVIVTTTVIIIVVVVVIGSSLSVRAPLVIPDFDNSRMCNRPTITTTTSQEQKKWWQWGRNSNNNNNNNNNNHDNNKMFTDKIVLINRGDCLFEEKVITKITITTFY